MLTDCRCCSVGPGERHRVGFVSRDGLRAHRPGGRDDGQEPKTAAQGVPLQGSPGVAVKADSPKSARACFCCGPEYGSGGFVWIHSRNLKSFIVGWWFGMGIVLAERVVVTRISNSSELGTSGISGGTRFTAHEQDLFKSRSTRRLLHVIRRFRPVEEWRQMLLIVLKSVKDANRKIRWKRRSRSKCGVTNTATDLGSRVLVVLLACGRSVCFADARCQKTRNNGSTTSARLQRNEQGYRSRWCSMCVCARGKWVCPWHSILTFCRGHTAFSAVYHHL